MSRLEHKPSYVGPKKVLIGLSNLTESISYTFPTSISYNKFIEKLTQSEHNNECIELHNGSSKFMIENHKWISSVIFPQSELVLRKSSKSFISLLLHFKSGAVEEVYIAGEHRFRLAYRDLSSFVGLSVPTNINDVKWLLVPQEENKMAYIRYSDVLIGISSMGVE